MVLARKKLKQKLHTLLPGGEGEAGAEAKKIKVRLVSSKRPRPKRARRPKPKKSPKKKKKSAKKPASVEDSPAPAVEAVDGEEKVESAVVDVAVSEEKAAEEPVLDEAALALKAARRKEEKIKDKKKKKEKKEKMRLRKLKEAEEAAKRKADEAGEEQSEEEPEVDEAVLAQRAEVERRREERRKEKKEKRRVRRLMEAEAAVNKESEPEAEATANKESEPEAEKQDDVEAAGAEAEASEEKLDITKVEGEAEKNESEEVVKKIKSEEAGVSDNPIVSQDSEQSIKKVYVGGIPYYSSEDDIRSFFEGCGSITALDCMTFPDTGKFRGIAILTLKTDAAAKRALALDGADMGGFLLKVQPYKANREKVKANHEKEDFAPKMIEGYNRIYVGNLAWDSSEDDLRKFFSDCKIASIRFGTDKETGEFKGFAHVDFSDSTSLAIALKLDQNVIKGRPVRIRCAVPKKENQKSDDNAKSDSSKNQIRTCYECGTPGHLSFACPNKKASEVISSEDKANVDSAEALSTKRRTCYECGVPGHISSACPNKMASEVIAGENKANIDSATTSSKKRRTCYECGVPGHLSSACPNKKASEVIADENKANIDSAPTLSKKRRTCYECGVPGHLSSACPNKSAPEVVSNYTQTFDEPKYAPAMASEQNKIGDGSNSAPTKRRKCYECGISGHLSSACPNKKAAEVDPEAKPVGGSSTVHSAISGENKPSDDTSSAPPKKKKRRTCYECGIAGHLSSECPNKAK